MRGWKPVDIIVVMLSAVIAIVVASSVLAVVLNGKAIAPEKAKMLNALISSIVSIITLYVGAMIQRHKDKD